MRRVTGWGLLLSSACAFAAKPPAPATRLPLADLGFPGYRAALMRAGASMATLHLLDKNHLLLTFGLRGLVPRLPGDDVRDSDRLVGAEVVEISTGKVLDRTEWRLHDHGRYLWSVGHGVFVLRSGDALSTFVPLRGLASHTSFQRVSLPHRPGHPELISGSPDGNIVTIEIQKHDEPDEGISGDAPRLKHTVLEFYRITEPKDPEHPLEVKSAGAIGSPGLLRIALDGDGYLWAETKETDRYKWAVSFNEYEGKPQDLLALDSSCSPRMELLSRSELAVVSCKGSDDSKVLSTYGFDGQLNWQMGLGGESLQPPTFVSAGDAGRFAMSRLVASSTGQPANASALDNGLLSQIVRVYAIASGTPLLTVACSPAARTPENFDLSPDGRTLAVLSTETIDLYTLPELSTMERKDLEDARTMTPPEASGPVVLHRITRPVVAEEQAIASEETTTPQPADAGSAVASAGAATTGGEAGRSQNGPATVAGKPATGQGATGQPVTVAAGSGSSGSSEGEENGPRKPPTLLAPGEVPENKVKVSRPQ